MLGYIDYEINGGGAAALKYISAEGIPCFEMQQKGETLYLSCMAERRRQLEEFMEQHGIEYRRTGSRGIIFKIKKLLRPGLILGGLAAAAAVIFLSNVVFRFEILSDDPEIRSGIMAVLDENGVKGGSFIPSLDLTVLERELKQNVEGISWAGISCDGTTLIIDVIANVEKPEQLRTRMPSDLVAKCDAVIDKVEVYDGQLMTTVGSGVRKGDVLVSGKIVTEKITYENGKEIRDEKVRYARSLGKIYGTFTRRETFTQPFEIQRRQPTGEEKDLKYLSVCDIDIPLFFGGSKGRYSETSDVRNISLFGLETPLNIKNVHLEEFYYRTETLDKEQAKAEAEKQEERFRNNFLCGYEIKKVDKKEKITENGVEITAEYTLYGEISEEMEFFMPKTPVGADTDKDNEK